MGLTETRFEKYRPEDAWYLHEPGGIHGLGHAARVLIWAERIGRALADQGTIIDLEAVRWAAALHDVRRMDDAMDAEHGRRAAEWIASGRPAVLGSVAPEIREKIRYCCEWHVPSDRYAPAMTPELICLKDADGLDRVRIDDLNAGYLRADIEKMLCGRAQELFDLTAWPENDPWDAVIEAARCFDPAKPA